ncbi:MAG: ABC transporter ATP-binding protein, partial [Betaproteobacteria bacterium]
MTDTALTIRGLHKSYGDVHAVSGLDLDVAAGECFGLLGPNGAGKTTTIEICEGLLDADAGDVEVLGMRWRTHERTLRECLGIQLQDTQLSEKLTVAETLRLFRSFYERGRVIDEVISLVQLTEKRDSRVGTLSGGQKQRIAVACALVGDPKHLFLDGDPIAESLRLLHIMGRQHDRAPLGSKPLDEVPELASRLRVEA